MQWHKYTVWLGPCPKLMFCSRFWIEVMVTLLFYSCASPCSARSLFFTLRPICGCNPSTILSYHNFRGCRQGRSILGFILQFFSHLVWFVIWLRIPQICLLGLCLPSFMLHVNSMNELWEYTQPQRMCTCFEIHVDGCVIHRGCACISGVACM